MNIIVNTLSVNPGAGGVETYLRRLTAELAHVTSDVKITLLCGGHNKSLFKNHVSQPDVNVERKVLPLRGGQPILRILFDQVIVPLYCLKYDNAVLL
ncbi:hypothetical protein, partial [Halorubrum sp. GN11_10-6_MGM]|uniref:hypothetical protein n=1 Tax=Halorubrum sp. GN11_10-6_MGM TaxID=2518112 RepID=UPI001A7E08CB